MVTEVAPSEFGDNAIMTYCYIDKKENMLKYRFIRCMRQFVNRNVEGRDDYSGEPIDFKEGEINADAFLMKIYSEDGSEPYEDIVNSIKMEYGFYDTLCIAKEDIFLDQYRHPCDSKKLLGILLDPEIGEEYVWVKEKAVFSKYITAELLEEPKETSFGVNKGDEVTVIEIKREGEVLPIIKLNWMEHYS